MFRCNHCKNVHNDNIVACLTIKRIPDNEIINNIFDQTNKTMTERHLKTSGISTNSSVDIMLYAILQTKTGSHITLIIHTHNYFYPQFSIEP
ncbi:MAG: hypothetical protein WBZ50_09740, partial [Nitrososphaeraceae archaeon]